MSGDNYLTPAKKQKLSYNYDAQKHTRAETVSSEHMRDVSVDDQIYSKLKQEQIGKFKVLDQVKEDNYERTSGSDGKSQGTYEEKFNSLLGVDVSDNGETEQEKPSTEDYTTKTKIFLEEKFNNRLELLPTGWIMSYHASGMPVYMHYTSKVCTLSKPYFIGTGNVEHHSIPMGAIPCYAYRRALEEEAKGKLKDQKIDDQIRNGPWMIDSNSVATYTGSQRSDETPRTAEKSESVSVLIKQESIDGVPKNRMTNEGFEERNEPANSSGGISLTPKIEAISDSWQDEQLTPDQINNYCKTLFHFKTKNVLHFKNWAARRKYCGKRRRQNPQMQEGTKLVTIPALLAAAGQYTNSYNLLKANLAMNMDDPRYLSMFDQLVHRVLKSHPKYQFTQENPSTLYQATVYIRETKYGVGEGFSKRQAAAARASIEILIPEMKDELDKHAPHSAPATEPDFTFFDSMSIEDPRVVEMCRATCEPLPYASLCSFMHRKFGVRRHINIEVKKLAFQKTELIMKVGEHTATVVGRNKRTAKQRASQAILQILHPQATSWSSLLRMINSTSDETNWESKIEQQSDFEPQSQAQPVIPNRVVLSKLQNDMKQLCERDAAGVCVATLHPPCNRVDL